MQPMKFTYYNCRGTGDRVRLLLAVYVAMSLSRIRLKILPRAGVEFTEQQPFLPIGGKTSLSLPMLGTINMLHLSNTF